MAEASVHVRIVGLVQGVGYRAWCKREADARGLSGWVRNRATGEVEAVFSGPRAAVDAMIEACREGPPGARVREVAVEDGAAAASGPFRQLGTV